MLHSDFIPARGATAENGPYSPAMVASMTDAATGAWVGTHITYLRTDGTGKAEGTAKNQARQCRRDPAGAWMQR